MADIVQKFTGDITDLENKLAKAQAEYLKLRDSIAITRRESRESADETSAGLGRQISQIQSNITGMVTLGAAVGVAKSAYREWITEMIEAGRVGNQLNRDLLSGLVSIGALTKVGPISAFVKQAPSMGMTREQAEAAALGVIGAAPSMGTDKQIQIAKEAGKLAPIAGPGEIRQFAEISGRIGTMFSDKSPQELANLTLALQSRVGQDVGQVTSEGFLGGVRALVDAGALTPEQGLGLGVLAIQKKMPTGLIERLFGKVNQPMEAIIAHHGKALTPGQKEKNIFAETPAADRFRMLIEDPKMQEAILGERLAGRIGGEHARITMGEISGLAELISKDEKNALYQNLAATAKTTIGAQVANQQAQATRAEQAAITYEEPIGREHLRRKSAFEEEIAGYGAFSKFFARGAFSIVEGFRNLTGVELPGTAPPQQDNNLNRLIETNNSELKKQTHEMRTTNRTLTTNQATNAAQAARVNGRE